MKEIDYTYKKYDNIKKDSFLVKEISWDYLYNDNAGNIVLWMDNDSNMNYTSIVHWGLIDMIWQLDVFRSPQLQELFADIKLRKDIWTWNGIITNKISNVIIQLIADSEILSILWNLPSSIHQSITRDKIPAILNYLKQNSFSIEDGDFLKVQYCDLYKESLYNALNWSHYFNLKQKIIQTDIEYLDIQNKESLFYYYKPTLITLFNVFANFSEEKIITSIKNISNILKKGDIFIPSFFQDYNLWDDKQLYNNKETELWIKIAIQEKYKKSFGENLKFIVEVWNDGRNYIDVWAYEDSAKIYHHGFRSYRDTKEYLTKIFEDIWLSVYMRLESPDKRQIAPILYKQ